MLNFAVVLYRLLALHFHIAVPTIAGSCNRNDKMDVCQVILHFAPIHIQKSLARGETSCETVYGILSAGFYLLLYLKTFLLHMPPRDQSCQVSHRRKIKLSQIYLEVSDYILLDENAKPGDYVSAQPLSFIVFHSIFPIVGGVLCLWM